MNWNLLVIPGVAFGRAILGWLENSLEDNKIDLPEWRKLGSTIIRMGLPMVALVWGLHFNPGAAAGVVILLDLIIVKLYNALKKKK